MNFQEVEELHRIAVDAGDDYLIAAVAEIKRRGTEMARLMTEAHIAKDEARESKRYSQWLKDMFIEPHAECDQMHWEREAKVLAIVRDTSIKPDDKLAQIEDALTWSDEELADER